MKEKNELIYGFGLNIFTGWYRIWKIKQAIKNGDKSARNYAILCEWYGSFKIFCKSFQKKALYYAFKSIRADKNYPLGYLYAGVHASSNKAKIKYLLKTIELGGDDAFLARFVLYMDYLEEEQYALAYKTITEFLHKKSPCSIYWAYSAFINAHIYGYGIEYKISLKELIHSEKNIFNIFTIDNIIPLLSSFLIILMNIYFKQFKHIPNNCFLNAFSATNDYENQLILVNRLILREKRNSNKKNEYLAYLYFEKAYALMFKENSEYDKALEALEQYKKYTKDISSYYGIKAIYAFCEKDYRNSYIYANESLLLKKTNIEVLKYKGYACRALGKFEEAKDILTNVVKLSGNKDHNVFYFLAMSLYGLKEYKESLKNINQALLLTQKYPDYYLMKARCLEALEKFEEAKKYYNIYEELIK